MDWLLKIVEGPMKGAEIALPAGRRTSFGSSDACDVVVADASVPGEAFWLDVTAEGVTLAEPGGAAKLLPPYEVHETGTTAVAVGPAEGTWGPLVRPSAPPAAAEVPAEEARAEEAAAEEAGEESAGAARGRGCLGKGCAAALVFLLLAGGGAGVAGWFWRDEIVAAAKERLPRLEETFAKCVAGARGVGESRVAAEAKKGPGLAEIAAQHGLELVEGEGGALLKGNLKRRTERLAVRALALAADAGAKLDLTDDETLLSAAGDLLFAATDGMIKADAATNRTVWLSGHAGSAEELAKAVEALRADVPAAEKADVSRVKVGGPPPPGSPAAKRAPAKAPEKKPAAKPKEWPVAGILMQPYPCVVLRSGMRLAEGAQLGGATVVKIEAERLVLRAAGGGEFEWRP